jgi:Uncharacterized protein involved in methicillin resistance
MTTENHFLQSEDWERFQVALGRRTFRGAVDGCNYLSILESTPVGKYLYVPYGPSAKNKACFEKTISELKKLAKKNSCFFIRVEPTEGVKMTDLKELGFRKIPEINPEHTWVLDLARDEEVLLAEMKQNNRNLFRNYTGKGIEISHTSDPRKIHYLTSLLNQVARNNTISVYGEEYLKKQMEIGIATLYLAKLNGEIIAASLVYDSPTTRYYAHAAADYEHRKLSAGTSLVAKMIFDAKESGLRTFDFYGITTSDDPNHPWYGFSKFKKSFGGSQKTYLGTWDFPINKLRYSFFVKLRGMNRRARKFKNILKK